MTSRQTSRQNRRPGRPAEPALTAESVRLVLAGLVALGWWHTDDARLMAIATAVAVLVSILASVAVRARVVPLIFRGDTDALNAALIRAARVRGR